MHLQFAAHDMNGVNRLDGGHPIRLLSENSQICQVWSVLSLVGSTAVRTNFICSGSVGSRATATR